MIIIVSIFISGYAMANILKYMRITRNKLLAIIIAVVLIFFFTLLDQILSYETYKKLRNVDLNLSDILKITLRQLLIIVFPTLLVLTGRNIIREIIRTNEVMDYIIWVLLTLISILIYPYTLKLLLRAKPCKSHDLIIELSSFLKNHNIQKANIYIWPSKNEKIANAYICGLIAKYIFISDYLVYNLDMDEIKAVLAHEIGHWKKHHIEIRILLMLFTYPLFLIVSSFLDYLATFKNINIPIPIGIFITFLVFFIYISMILGIFRKQEYAADKYAIMTGVKYEVYRSALSKLALLNDLSKHTNIICEKLQTHPHIERRIYYITNIYKQLKREI
ncbi:M48 family metallopeptidase [Caldicellulosiruptor morganii]|uniref:M48 family metallopeptidase n=1 Tax=Caldicellulosiruptor morganii TaxID=1387555 RepID=A0ABY7BQX2_9FIRM|nr:M48 family metallopeptidase [Caldicellulosiruptor morganii]WAM34925.1 M48 family metallopeptidase [Caldicellulosiruptor morganii]